MKLHCAKEDFNNLSALTAEYIGIPFEAVKRDYFIVMILRQLAESSYADKCVFKGGTSLSKCYPNSIARFSEDIDLTYIPSDDMKDKQCEKALKAIEKQLSYGFNLEKIEAERNSRNKSSYIWFEDKSERIKLEIGSSVRPDPYSKRKLKTYIQEFLEHIGSTSSIDEYELSAIEVNVLNIERTFLDKVMAVKRHALCGTLMQKVRHIYDVTMLYKTPDIKTFLEDKSSLKRLITETKYTDEFYLQKRNIPEQYNPLEAYNFTIWQSKFDRNIRNRYESLHKDLLYTNEKQSFDEAIEAFTNINALLAEIGE